MTQGHRKRTLYFSCVNYNHILSTTKTRSKELFLGFQKKNHSRNILNVSPIICSQMISNGGLVIRLFLFCHVTILFQPGINQFPPAAPILTPAPGPAKGERAGFTADAGGCRLPGPRDTSWTLLPSSRVPLHLSLHSLPKVDHSVPASSRISASLFILETRRLRSRKKNRLLQGHSQLVAGQGKAQSSWHSCLSSLCPSGRQALKIPQYFSFLSSVQFSCSVVSDSLRLHGLQPAGLPVHHQLPEFTQTHIH